MAWAAVTLGVFAGIATAAVAAEYPNPERFREAITAFTEAEALDAPVRGAIVATGSSSMRGWHSRIAKDLAPLTIIPRGFGGSNMYDVVHFVQELVLRHQPRAVLLYEGDNDVAAGVEPQAIVQQFEAFIAVVHESLPETRIYTLSIKPSIARWSMWEAMQTANELLKARCAEDDRLIYVDVATPMLTAEGEPRKDIFVADMLHMNDKGYDVWRSVVQPVLLEGELRFEPPADLETDP